MPTAGQQVQAAMEKRDATPPTGAAPSAAPPAPPAPPSPPTPQAQAPAAPAAPSAPTAPAPGGPAPPPSDAERFDDTVPQGVIDAFIEDTPGAQLKGLLDNGWIDE